jgi:hypothetical protein
VRRPRRVLALLAALISFAAVGACSGGGGEEPASTTTTVNPGTIAPDDPELTELLLSAADLPDGFTATEDVGDTITTFCAGQDATAGLSAMGRAIVGFTRTPAGASVIEVVFRFADDGAAQFVDQADDLLASCSEVPDGTGLAFTYEPPDPAVADSLLLADRHVSRYGTSVGSGSLTIDVAAAQVGDLGVLVAVLGVDQPRVELDRLATEAFAAAVAKLDSGP